MKSKTAKMNRYERIMARPDKKRGWLLKEFNKKFKGLLDDSMVLNLKLLNTDGSTMAVTWSEKLADGDSK